MFNKELKERYIIEKENGTVLPNNYLPRCFKTTEQFECDLNKDISCFTVYEIIDMYKVMNLSSFESLIMLNSHLSLYTQWCLQQNLIPDCQDHFSEITQEMIMKCINTVVFYKSIIDKDTLYSWLRQLVNPSDAFIMISLFEGIKGKEFCEIYNLRLSDFDLEKNKVKLCTGRVISVSDKLIEIAKESAIKYDYTAVTQNEIKTIPFWEDEYSDLIVKNYPNCSTDVSSFQKGRRIYNKITRNFKMLGIDQWMKPNSLAESGKIDFVKTRAKELGITPYNYLYSYHVNELIEKYDCSINILFYKKYKDILEK